MMTEDSFFGELLFKNTNPPRHCSVCCCSTPWGLHLKKHNGNRNLFLQGDNLFRSRTIKQHKNISRFSRTEERSVNIVLTWLQQVCACLRLQTEEGGTLRLFITQHSTSREQHFWLIRSVCSSTCSGALHTCAQ